MFEIKTQKDNQETIVFLDGVIDSTTAEKFAAGMEGVLRDQPTALILDFEKVDYISSVGFRILFMVAKEMKKNKGKFSARKVGTEIQNLFNMVHMDHVMEILA